MSTIASYILASYSFIGSYPLDKILDVGNECKEGDPIPSFDEETLIELCNQAKSIFEKEQNTLYIEGEFFIVGDIHGNLHDLLRILNYLKDKKSKVVFLGDYVDRGNFSLECITLLFTIKLLYPDEFFLIRGNHEFDSICSLYGFKDEILNNYQFNHKNKNSNHNNIDPNKLPFPTIPITNCHMYTEKLYDAFIQAFSYLPISAILNKTTLCIHGGICPDFNFVKEIQSKIKRPINSFDESKLLKNLLWSDPSHNTDNMFTENQRGCGYQFNYEALNFFLQKNSLKRLVRGHQYVSKGYQEFFPKKCITVFSASSYHYDMSNYSGILRLDQKNDRVEYINFFPIQKISREDVYYYKVNGFFNHSDIKPKCYSIYHPIMASKTSTYNTSMRLLPKSLIKENSVRIIHLTQHPLHPNPRKTNPLIKVNNLMIGHTHPQKSILDEINSSKSESENDNLIDGHCINHFPVMNLCKIQEEI
ncbi:hypothetical protein M9Y10_010704 [Tritrichomonas musculus]|uniref:Serine/threonine-protein phosphatase n=1 Tax=Tritrichomonas musculus TaxID=1915356 RepID=A0ABR2ILK1_9EUKA